jgi:hypothetical protein
MTYSIAPYSFGLSVLGVTDRGKLRGQFDAAFGD